MKLIPTILCGGAGSRLWPVSRELHPKPFIRLQDGQSLLQKAYLRAMNIEHVSEILTITNQELFFKTQDEYQTIADKSVLNSYILEPFGRNTAAAIALGALYMLDTYEDDVVMLVLAADHLIQKIDAFNQAVAQAVTLAQLGKLVTFGIQPTEPETGYGYIHLNTLAPLYNSEKKNAPIGYEVTAFVEKPDLETAKAYLEFGEYLWNSGMFCFKASEVLLRMETLCPEILKAAKRTYTNSPKEKTKNWVQCRLDSKSFEAVPADSFDYAVMEPASRCNTPTASSKVVTVPCDIGWSDIGSWQALGDLADPDMHGNRVQGQAVMYDSTDCYVHSPTRLVGTVGVKDLIIIDTPDALLVANKERSQDVKNLYATLKSKGHETYKIHRTVHRPWGTYTILEESDRFKIKRIEVNPGGCLSLQMHHHRSEHWIVVSGMARVVNGEDQYLLGINESTYIAAGHQHRLENPGVVKLVMIEVQSGEYLGEDDIVRYQDHYGRVASELAEV